MFEIDNQRLDLSEANLGSTLFSIMDFDVSTSNRLIKTIVINENFNPTDIFIPDLNSEAVRGVIFCPNHEFVFLSSGGKIPRIFGFV